jgi:tRNA pseudouridine38-40 synthase
MLNLKLVISYDGERFYGFQKTKEGPSVEGELEKVLETIFQEPIILQAASRTDRGVHALEQVVNVKLGKPLVNLKRLLISINQLLPKDIAVRELEIASDEFHPTLDVLLKEYSYDVSWGPVKLPLQRRTAWHIHHCLDIEAMEKAASLLIGTHDFVAFTNQKKNEPYASTVRNVEKISIEKVGENLIRFTVIGRSFLYKMVRNIVGTLVYVGLGKIALMEIERILAGKDRKQAGVTAPSHGLTLVKVVYADARNK